LEQTGQKEIFPQLVPSQEVPLKRIESSSESPQFPQRSVGSLSRVRVSREEGRNEPSDSLSDQEPVAPKSKRYIERERLDEPKVSFPRLEQAGQRKVSLQPASLQEVSSKRRRSSFSEIKSSSRMFREVSRNEPSDSLSDQEPVAPKSKRQVKREGLDEPKVSFPRLEQTGQRKISLQPASLQEVSCKRRRSSFSEISQFHMQSAQQFPQRLVERHADIEDLDDRYSESRRFESQRARRMMSDQTGRQEDPFFTQAPPSATSLQKMPHRLSKEGSKRENDRTSLSVSGQTERSSRRHVRIDTPNDQDSTSQLSLSTSQQTRKRNRISVNPCQSDEDLYLGIFLNQLEPFIKNVLNQQLAAAFDGFVPTIMEAIRENRVKNLSDEEFIAAHLKFGNTFRNVRRGDRSNRQQLSIYVYVNEALTELFNKVKCNVLTVMRMQVTIYDGLMEALMGTMFPDEVHALEQVLALDEEKFLQCCERYIDDIVEVLHSKTASASFALVSDDMFETGCCSRLSHKDRMKLALAAGTILKGVLKKVLNEDVVEGAWGLIKMVPKMCGVDLPDEDANANGGGGGGTGFSIPIFDGD
jgi:hypothetical protein